MTYAGTWWALILLIIVPGIVAQAMVYSAMKKYSQVPARSGRTGAEAAAEIMRDAGITDVTIEEGDGYLGDHYDPSKKMLVLSGDVYHGRSVAALGIAAHESGHAIQHKNSYAPLQVRMALVPATMIVSQMLPFVIIGGFWFRFQALILLGIGIYTLITLFQLITLPVEFDASARAKKILPETGLLGTDEMVGVHRVLNAAALTYVAALIASAGHLLRLILLSRNRR